MLRDTKRAKTVQSNGSVSFYSSFLPMEEEDIFRYVNRRLEGAEEWTTKRELNDASVCIMLCLSRMQVPKDMRMLLVKYARSKFILAIELTQLLKRERQLMKMVLRYPELLDRMCSAMYELKKSDVEVNFGTLLQSIIPEDKEADKAAAIAQDYMDDVKGLFHAARWYARNDQYPQRTEYLVWQFWASFNPSVSIPIQRLYQYPVFRGSSSKMLEELVTQSWWDLGNSLYCACVINSHEHIAFLINHGADVNAKYDGRTPVILWPSTRGHREVVEALIKHGADVNAKDKHNDTALILASHNGHIDIVKVLLKNGADMNVRGSCGLTALMQATRRGHLDTIKVLLKNGADVNVRGPSGWTALNMAYREGTKEVVDLLKEHGANRVFY